jgi:NAD(P)-dependent dehydrogenase (short-subunit alcohol dehydrogenase family)
LAIELAPFAIVINNIAPGAIETPINADLGQDQECFAKHSVSPHW